MRCQTIVVGYDGSEDSDRALDAAAELVADGGVVHVVTAFHPHEHARVLEMMPEEFRYTYDPEAEERNRLSVGEKRLTSRGVATEAHLVPDHAASAILDVAEREGADLIVVGSRGLGRVARFVRGSVSARVATHAPMSVLVVHGDE